MSYQNLPTELLEEIMKYAWDDGSYESIMLTCKRFYFVHKDRLDRYNPLRQAWKVIGVGTNESNDFGSVMSLLNVIAEEPIAGHLIRMLDLNFPEAGPDAGPGEYRMSNALIKLLQQSTVFRRAGPSSLRWPSMMSRVHSDGMEKIYRIAFLLTLVPNLKVLRLPADWGNRSVRLGGARRVMSLLVSDAKSRPGRRPLAQLRRLTAFNITSPTPLMMSDIQSLMQAPKLSDLSLYQFVANDQVRPRCTVNWPQQASMPGIRNIALERSLLDARNIGGLLSRCPNTISFSYSHNCRILGSDVHEFDAGAFVKAVQIHVGSHLRVLRITMSSDSYPDYIRTGITDLRQFQQLSYLDLHVALFDGPPLDGRDLSRRHRREIPSSAFLWELRTTPAISDILPVRILSVNLTITRRGDIDVLKALFRNTKDLLHSQRFPDLYSFVVEREPWFQARLESIPDNRTDVRQPSLAFLDGTGVTIRS